MPELLWFAPGKITQASLPPAVIAPKADGGIPMFRNFPGILRIPKNNLFSAEPAVPAAENAIAASASFSLAEAAPFPVAPLPRTSAIEISVRLGMQGCAPVTVAGAYHGSNVTGFA